MVIIMKYDLIALDMDGTLLNDDKVIPKENVDENQMKINFETGEVEQNG